jgi:signal transduction histidine kinase
LFAVFTVLLGVGGKAKGRENSGMSPNNNTVTYLPGSESVAPPDLRSSQELASLFAGADVGLALFDSNLALLACNSLYRSLCGYQDSEAATGKNLRELMTITFRRQNVPDAEIQQRIDRIVTTLDPGSAYSFRYAAPSGRVVEVRRRRLPNGTVVETVKQIEASAAQGPDMNSQYEMIAERSRARLMHALDVMVDGFGLYDANDRLVLYNKKYVDFSPLVSDVVMPGVPKEEILRESVRRGAFVLNGMEPEDYIQWRLERHRNPTGPVEVQFTDGRWIMITERRTDDGGIVGTRSDITEMKLREMEMLRISQQLHAKNIQFDSALSNMNMGLCMFDKEQRLIVVNRQYLDLYGFAPDVVKPGITLRGLMEYSVSIGNYTQEQAEKALAERNDPERLSKRSTIKQRLKDGRIIAVMNEPMSDGGTIATYHDITESERSAETMLEYTKKLERSNRELADFAYVASHDLQEPLRKIEAFGDRLAKKYATILPEDGKMFIDRMQNAAGRMRRLINDLLSYSRVTTAAKPFQITALNEVVADVVSDLQIRIEENKGKVDVTDLPAIEGDPVQLRQLLQNIIGNALKFKKPGVDPVVKVSAAMTEDHLLKSPGPAVVLTISDNGIGFDNQFRDQIFTIFQRLHSRNEYEGTGIGLATCRKIVERHGGMIIADGCPDEGSTFTVTLPKSQDQKEQAA